MNIQSAKVALTKFKTAVKKLSTVVLKAGFDPNQPRGPGGKWSSSGGGSSQEAYEGPMEPSSYSSSRGKTKTYTFENDGSDWRESKADDEGGDSTMVDVEEKGRNHYVFDTHQYYSKDGSLKLEITQPLGRALETYAALLEVDARLERQRGN